MANEANTGVANLIPIKKGEVRNPRGRPKGSMNMSTRIIKILNKKIDWDKINVKDVDRLKTRYGKTAVADAMIWTQVSKILANGDTQAFNALREAGWGRMVNVDADIKAEVVHIVKPEKLQLIQIESAAEQLRQRALKAVEGEIVDGMDSPTGTTDIRPLDT
jgi:hypothetical protein